MTPISDIRKRAEAARHEESQGPWPEAGHVCLTCWQPWPCDARNLLEALDSLTAERDALRAGLEAVVEGIDNAEEAGIEWPPDDDFLDALVTARALLRPSVETRECLCEGEFIWACGPECRCYHHQS